MAKRFIDTKLFDDSWFLELSNEAKIFFIYFITRCDHAGILDLSKSKLKFETHINSIETVLKQFKNRLIKLRDNYYFMPAFVKFQYRELSEKAPAQRSVINRLKEFNLIDKNNTVIKQFGKSLQTLQDKDKDKDMDKEKAKEKDILYFINDIKFKDILKKWLDYKKSKNQTYKNEASLKALYNNILELSNSNHDIANKIINQSMANNWAGLFPLKDNNKPKGGNGNDFGKLQY